MKLTLYDLNRTRRDVIRLINRKKNSDIQKHQFQTLLNKIDEIINDVQKMLENNENEVQK